MFEQTLQSHSEAASHGSCSGSAEGLFPGEGFLGASFALLSPGLLCTAFASLMLRDGVCKRTATIPLASVTRGPGVDLPGGASPPDRPVRPNVICAPLDHTVLLSSASSDRAPPAWPAPAGAPPACQAFAWLLLGSGPRQDRAPRSPTEWTLRWARRGGDLCFQPSREFLPPAQLCEPLYKSILTCFHRSPSAL